MSANDDPLPSAIADVIKERHRQITVEKWTPLLDDQHKNMELAACAASYALHAPAMLGHYGETLMDSAALWPGDFTEFKPQDHRRNCVRAAALLIAEIERLDRRATRTKAA